MKKMIAFLLACLMAMSITIIAYAEETPPVDISVGSILAFGNYEQDADETNGKEPLEWIVLDVQDNKALLLSKYVIDTHQYHDKLEAVTWETCEAREWLNSDFLEEVFSDKERKAILLTPIDNSSLQDDPYYTRADSGNDTEDYIFYLSSFEARDYIQSDAFRAGEATKWALQHNAVVADGIKTEWFLRSAGLGEDRVCTNCDTGMPVAAKVFYSGNTYGVGDRPAMWVDLTSESIQSAEVTGENYFSDYFSWLEAYENPSDSRLRTEVLFGHYEQDGDQSNGTEPIEWIVADIQNDKCLLISKYILERMQYSEYDQYYLWEHSRVKGWLNDTFYKTAFNEDEQEMILLSVVDNSFEQSGCLKKGGNDTEDRIFLLSYMEASKYFPTDESRKGTPTQYVLNLPDAGSGTSWRNRSPYSWNNHVYQLVVTEGVRGFMVSTTVSGIRPAMWVSMDALDQ